MSAQKYSVNQQLVETLLSFVKSGDISIPEIQRPFVWKNAKVRDLLDSLYQGYPVGYLITWQNPDVKLKQDGAYSTGNKVLIDGQQRITALKAAILGDEVISSDYKKIKIKIAFNPMEEKFEVSNPAIEKDKTWIPNIATLLSEDMISILSIVREYCSVNEDVNEVQVEQAISRLLNIKKMQIGMIELAHDLDIETVSEIFIRINSQGVVLSQADFVMSKIASNEIYDGSMLRKAVDYFCHTAIQPAFYEQIKNNDEEFVKSIYYPRMKWLKDDNDDLFDPEYTDMLRVAFTYKFGRGKLSDLVNLLSGRNFETRTYEEEIAEASFNTLKDGVMDFMKQTNFERFVMIIKSSGFIIPSMIRSKNALNFAYIVYLKLVEMGIDSNLLSSYVSRWFVLSILTGRYSGSPESRFDFDIKQIAKTDFSELLTKTENGELSDAFWDVVLPQKFDSSVASSPYFNVFIAAQNKMKNRGFLSKDITVYDMVSHRGDIHHIFPRDYLKKNGFARGKYNQIANYVYTESPINIKIGNKAPEIYFSHLQEQCETGNLHYGAIKDMQDLKDNLSENAIPLEIFDMGLDDYDAFLTERRKLMSQKIKSYYENL